MSKIQLQFPIEVGGKSISSVTVRRPKGKDMIALGDHLPNLARFDGTIPDAVPDGTVFKAMVAIAASLADLGDAAGELDVDDLTSITEAAFARMGEPKGRGQAQTNGAAQTLNTPVPFFLELSIDELAAWIRTAGGLQRPI